jgi:hypothetical protein
MSVSVKFGQPSDYEPINYKGPGKWIYRGRVFGSYQDADEAREDERVWGAAYAADDERDTRRDEG